MTLAETLAELEQLGTAQNRKVYSRHGVTDCQVFGVSYANLGKLKKKIKTDHPLAVELWETGIHDAMVLATMVADPLQLKVGDANRWLKQCTNYVVGDGFCKLVANSNFAMKKADQWINSKNEWISTAGWAVLNQQIVAGEVSDEAAANYLQTIESELQRSPNRTRYAMNNCLIAIGIQNAKLQKLAIAAAKRIGIVKVDHGETGCKTPDAVSYINKTVAYQKKKATKKKATKKKFAKKKAASKKSKTK